jgi:hypothetical protein
MDQLLGSRSGSLPTEPVCSKWLANSPRLAHRYPSTLPLQARMRFSGWTPLGGRDPQDPRTLRALARLAAPRPAPVAVALSAGSVIRQAGVRLREPARGRSRLPGTPPSRGNRPARTALGAITPEHNISISALHWPRLRVTLRACRLRLVRGLPAFGHDSAKGAKSV